MCCVIGYTGHDMSADKFKEYLMRAGRTTSVWWKGLSA